jgi:prolyl-tRNA synthetase
MRLSSAFIPTLKEIPSDAEVVSHRVMLKGGMVRLLAAGIYSHLPLMWRVILKAQAIIRQEMNAIGGQEFHLPALNPQDLWDETGRNADFGPDVFRLEDRKGRPYLLAPTHEEVIGDIARAEIRSYRDLPQIWYQIQTKFRDEPRPRSGVLRSREFIMKDSYSLDASPEGLDRSYDLHALAYRRIFARCGLRFFVAGASSGLMGGSGSQEFLVEGAAGEDQAVVCEACGYAANVEVARTAWGVDPGSGGDLEEVATPDQRTIDEVSAFLGLAPERLIKSLLYMTAQDEPVMFLVPGSHELHESKAMAAAGSPVRPAEPEEVERIMGAPAGFIGPAGAPADLRVLADLSMEGVKDGATGANRTDHHVIHLDLARDARVERYVDLRAVASGEACPSCGQPVRIITAIEMGHIFKLGTKYSIALKAHFQDEAEEMKPIIMGSYGIGLERIAAAAIEQNVDDDGFHWPASIAPFDVYLLCVNTSDAALVEVADRLYDGFREAGLEALYDDRSVRAGTKFKDADLLGIPWRINIGGRGVARGVVELVRRATRETVEVPIEDVVTHVRKAIDEEIAGYDRKADELS